MARTRLERLHRHRILMEVAVAEGLSLDAARELLIDRRRAATERARKSVNAIRAEAPATPIAADEAREPRYWWEKY